MEARQKRWIITIAAASAFALWLIWLAYLAFRFGR
jgi:hypothetical protein